MQKIYSIIKWIFALFFLSTTFYGCYHLLDTRLIYHQQQPAFLSDKYFFASFAGSPGGLAEYISLFFTQLFHSKIEGAIVITCLIGLMVLLSFLLFKRTGSSPEISFYLAFIVPLLFLALFFNYNFPAVVAFEFLIILLFLCGFTYIPNRWYSIIISLVMAVLIYHVAGSGSFLIFCGGVIAAVISSGKWKRALLYILIIIPFAYFYPQFVFKHVYAISSAKTYFYFIPDLPVMILYRSSNLLNVALYSLPVLVLFGSGLNLLFLKIMEPKIVEQPAEQLLEEGQEEQGEEKESIVRIIIQKVWFKPSILVVYGVLFYFSSELLISSVFNKHTQNIIKADFYAFNEEWDKVIETALQDKSYEFSINYNYNRAIDHKGILLDSIFEYPQFVGADILFPDKIATGAIAMTSSDFYFDLGYISEAQHWAYEAQTIQPYSPRVLKRLVLTNLIIGNYKMAEKILEVLDKNPVCSDFVTQYKSYLDDTTLIASNKMILQKRTQMPVNTILSGNVPRRFLELLDKDSTNKRAYEYLQVYLLLSHKLGDFVKIYNERGQNLNYKRTPILFEQAFLLYKTQDPKIEPIHLRISSKSQKEFIDFSQILMKFNGNKHAAKIYLKQYYSNTYWSYLLFDSPLVTKASIQSRPVEN